MGNLADKAKEKVSDLIRARGGNASTVREAGPWAEKTLGDTADAAVEGDASAETAIKLVKQEAQKAQKY